MSKNRISEEGRELQFASFDETCSDENAWLPEEVSNPVRCWDVQHHAKTKCIPMKEADLFRVFAMFPEVDSSRVPLLAQSGYAKWLRPELVTIERSQLESLISRISALEDRLGIQAFESHPQTALSESVQLAVLALTNELFNIKDTSISREWSEDEECLVLTVRAGADANPRDMATKTSEWHDKLVNANITSTNLRLRVSYE